MTSQDRCIPLEGAKNFRDFGGYSAADGRTVKRGLLFRSDSLHQLTASDYERISKIGIASICDLRRDRERLHAPTNWSDPTASIYHLPLISNNVENTVKRAAAEGSSFNEELARQMMINVYKNLVSEEHALLHLRQMFSLVAEPANLPVLIHCSGGKDRTGVSCALILWMLGVSREDIYSDYLRSQQLYGDKVDVAHAAAQLFEHQEVGEWQYAALKLMFGAQKVFLDTVFTMLDENKLTPERFVTERIGAREDMIERLKDTLLTD